MILLFTDFGFADPYVGQLHRRIIGIAGQVPIIDSFHSVPAFNVKAGAYLLAHYCPPVPGSVYCCVVDPGVGGNRQPLIIEIDECHYVGPDNGLFEILVRRHQSAQVKRIDWLPDSMSPSFHGRDLFAPVAAFVAMKKEVRSSPADLADFSHWPDDLDEIVYIDHYGNSITGRRASTIAKASEIEFKGGIVAGASTFSDVPVGSLFWYENANGLIELAINQGSTTELIDSSIGDPVILHRKITRPN